MDNYLPLRGPYGRTSRSGLVVKEDQRAEERPDAEAPGRSPVSPAMAVESAPRFTLISALKAGRRNRYSMIAARTFGFIACQARR